MEITDEVTIQFYGDERLINRIQAVLRSNGFTVPVGQTKPYETRKGKKGTYSTTKITI